MTPTGTTGNFDKAFNAFRDYLAQSFKVAPAEIMIVPSNEAMASDWDMILTSTGPISGKIGNAVSFEGGAKSNLNNTVRGWALSDGTVITLKQNLGRLFAEAGAWTPKHEVNVAVLAAKLIWAIGPDTYLYRGGNPSFQMEKDGHGVFTFRRGYRPPGPGTFEYFFDCIFTLSPDHTVVFKMTDNLNK